MEPDPNSLVPKGESGNYQDGQIHPKDDGGDNRHQHPTNVYFEFFKRNIPIFCFLAVIEGLALFLEHFADVFHGVFVELVNWISLCLQLLVVAVPVAKWVVKCGKTKKWVWIPYGIICLAMLVAFYFPTKPVDAVKNPTEWQPPELADGIKTAYLNFEGDHWTIDVDKLRAS
jgi:hypothetical protein